jgi:ankyrin repeat protein
MSSKFLVAVDNNDVSVVEDCIKTETPIAVKEAMIQACVTGKVDVARCIINSGVLDLTYTEEYSPLCLATKSGHLSVVELFFENPSMVFPYEHLALAIQWAAGEGELEILKFLQSRGGDIHYNDDSALCCAVRFGNVEVVKFLLENQANVTVHDNYCIRYAPFSNQHEILKLVLENGGDVHASEEEPLLHAAGLGHLDMVELLIQNGADIAKVYEDAIQRTQIYPTRARNEVASYLRSLKLE